MADGPRLFRVMLRVGDLDRAVDAYGKLLQVEGRKVGGGRAYFDCGSVILALLDTPDEPTSGPDDLYFAVADLEEAHARTRELGWLSKQEVHGESAGDIVTRPWGERSFYAEDEWGNGLCFVDASTLFTGRPS